MSVLSTFGIEVGYISVYRSPIPIVSRSILMLCASFSNFSLSSCLPKFISVRSFTSVPTFGSDFRSGQITGGLSRIDRLLCCTIISLR